MLQAKHTWGRWWKSGIQFGYAKLQMSIGIVAQSGRHIEEESRVQGSGMGETSSMRCLFASQREL